MTVATIDYYLTGLMEIIIQSKVVDNPAHHINTLDFNTWENVDVVIPLRMLKKYQKDNVIPNVEKTLDKRVEVLIETLFTKCDFAIR